LRMHRSCGTLKKVRDAFRKLVRERGLACKRLTVSVKPLTPEEAIGRVKRKDYPIIRGKERIIEASVLGGKGQAFTDSPAGFSGTLGGVLRLPLNNGRNRALVVAAINAACRALGLASGTVHCKGGDPERCGEKIAEDILSQYGICRVGVVGFNPAIAAHLVQALGDKNVRILDLDEANIGKLKFGVRIEDGASAAGDMVRWADIVLATGTTLVNGTVDQLLRGVRKHAKEWRLYGITCAGASALIGLPRLCHFGRNY